MESPEEKARKWVTLNRLTTTTLLLFEQRILTREQALEKLSVLGWTRGQGEQLLQGAYLLLPVV